MATPVSRPAPIREDRDLIRANALKVLQDDGAPAAAKMAASNMLLKLEGAAPAGSGLGGMDRDGIIAEINWCASQLGRKPL